MGSHVDIAVSVPYLLLLGRTLLLLISGVRNEGL